MLDRHRHHHRAGVPAARRQPAEMGLGGGLVGKVEGLRIIFAGEFEHLLAGHLIAAEISSPCRPPDPRNRSHSVSVGPRVPALVTASARRAKQRFEPIGGRDELMRMNVAIAALLALAGCATARPAAPAAAEPVQVRIIAFNDFHGALQPPRYAIPATGRTAARSACRPGGAAYLASAMRRLREGHPNSLVVSAGDLISASPLVSAGFLDEPTILAMNRIGLDFDAVGNHEFDRGRAELLRMQNGGCARHTARTPCRLDPRFPRRPLPLPRRQCPHRGRAHALPRLCHPPLRQRRRARWRSASSASPCATPRRW